MNLTSMFFSDFEKISSLQWMLLLSCFCLQSCHPTDASAVLTSGMVIDQSLAILPDNYLLEADENQLQPVLTITGEDITIDFQGAVLIGTSTPSQPNHFKGLAIRIQDGRNIVVKNAIVKGFKIGLEAENVEHLELINCDFSYNYRPKLRSDQDRLFTFSGANQEFGNKAFPQQYSAAVQLKNCIHSTIKNLTITQGYHAILLSNCKENLIYNNTLQFNSGIGIGLLQSTNNRIMHNRLDWNIGASDAAAVYMDENSRENTLSHNSFLHASLDSLIVQPEAVDETALPDGMETSLPAELLNVQKYALLNEWGPYNFQYPSIWLRKADRDQYTLLLMGPLGNWQLAGGEGFSSVNPKRGTFPATINAKALPGAKIRTIKLEFIGEKVTDQFGRIHNRGEKQAFYFHHKLENTSQ